jgi:hypothetical protein
MDRVQLVCTFVEHNNLMRTLDEIVDNFDIVYGKIFVFKAGDKYICSYNVVNDQRVPFLENSILVHRKKDTNTLYTINALNHLIREVNNGVLDCTVQLSWEQYTDSILLTANDQFRRIPIELHNIVYIRDKND